MTPTKKRARVVFEVMKAYHQCMKHPEPMSERQVMKRIGFFGKENLDAGKELFDEWLLKREGE